MRAHFRDMDCQIDITSFLRAQSCQPVQVHIQIIEQNTNHRIMASIVVLVLVEQKPVAMHLLIYEHQLRIALSPAQKITHPTGQTQKKKKSAILDLTSKL